MRAFPVAIASILLGAGLGVASAYRTVGPQQLGEEIAAIRGDAGSQSVDYPKFVVDATTHNFETMQRGSSKEHAFKVTNEGARPLTVEVLNTTCKCTVGDVADAPIPPGGTVDVKLSWVAKAMPGSFRQTATLKTNDPRAPRGAHRRGNGDRRKRH